MGADTLRGSAIGRLTCTGGGLYRFAAPSAYSAKAHTPAERGFAFMGQRPSRFGGDASTRPAPPSSPRSTDRCSKPVDGGLTAVATYSGFGPTFKSAPMGSLATPVTSGSFWTRA